MLIDKINLNLLRIFEVVYKTKSMTKASKELHMTQSGVSQNIKHLEELLGVVLFDRVKQRPVPTHKSKILFKVASQNLLEIEKALIEITEQEHKLAGTVCLGIPIEFGNNLVLPLLAKVGEENPNINFKIKYGIGVEINNLLLNGELDFAFVDTYGFDKQIKTQKIHDETLALCASKSYLKKNGPQKSTKDYFEGLDYIDYLPDAFILKSWFKHHMKLTNPNLRVKAILHDVEGMSRLICLGAGLGVLPLHIITSLKERGEDLQIIKGSGRPLRNTISIAWPKGRSTNAVVDLVFNYLVDSFKK